MRRRLTDAELAILRVLWSRGPSTMRDIPIALGREGSYTTVLKLLQIMTEKTLVRRDESSRMHVYVASSSEDEMQRQLVADLLDHVFDGSAEKLVLHALAAKKASPAEIAQVRRLLAKHRGGKP